MERFRWSPLALLMCLGSTVSNPAFAQSAPPPDTVPDDYDALPGDDGSTANPYGPVQPDPPTPNPYGPVQPDPPTPNPYGPALPSTPTPYGPALPDSTTNPYGPARPSTPTPYARTSMPSPYGPALPSTPNPYGPALPDATPNPYGPALPDAAPPFGPALPPPDPGRLPARVAPRIDPTLKPFLEHRVPEELASEGILLSRRNLVLELEQVGASWIVSLTDFTTQLVTASTLINALPDDREAAVAALTQVAASLTVQPFRVAPPSLADSIDEQIARRAKAARERRAKSERLYADIKLDLGNEVHVFASRKGTTQSGASAKANISITEHWVPYEGGQKIDIETFYVELGRQDLAQSYRNRRALKYVSWVGGLGLIGGGAVWLIRDMADHAQCVRDTPGNAIACPDGVNAGPLVLAGVGAAFSLLGVYLHGHPQPISHREAKRLVDNYNAKLRSELQLADRAPVLRDLRVAPYAAPSGGGLVLAGQF